MFPYNDHNSWCRCYGCQKLVHTLQKHGYAEIDKIDVTHTTTAGKLPIGIKWNAEEWRVPQDYKKRLRLVFAGYVRVPLSLKFYPSILGDGFELKPGKNDLVRELWWNKFHVGEVIENPNGQGLPFDGPGLPPPPNQKLLPAPQKQEPENKEHPGFGWDPGYGDD